MFHKVLVANRGVIACRILRTLARMGIKSVAVYSDADRHAPHVTRADEAVFIGDGASAETYLRQDKLLAAARSTGAAAIHPGYGFLSENAAFAEACAAAGVVFIGPTPAQMHDFGLKHLARELASRNNVALLPGSGLLGTLEQARQEAARIGFPVMLKSTAGGGGIGMQLVRQDAELAGALQSVERLASKSFNSGAVFLEKYIERARHIEVQIFGDGAGRVLVLGERDCSTQRRNQKIIEETPAPGLSQSTRARLHAAALRLASAVNYQSAGTVEFVYDVAAEDFYFLEVNTRLQVEHGVTEEVTGVDLVEWMVRLAANDPIVWEAPAPSGASIQVRLYAEDPARDFRPSSGLITNVRLASDARVETWIGNGTEVSPLYDPLLAKIITSAPTRAEALTKMAAALQATEVAGIETNLLYLKQLVTHPLFTSGGMTTRALEAFHYAPRTLEVIAGGTQSTLQDYPGRIGYWNVGVPPSGPMDALSFRLANQALGNATDAVALEMTLTGPSLKFNADAMICLTGAPMAADIDGTPAQLWTALPVRAGQTLRMGTIAGAGCRTYLALRGGFDVPAYLGSRSTFTLGNFGGHGGRALKVGDVLHMGSGTRDSETGGGLTIPPARRPVMGEEWTLDVLYGPHGAPDFFTESDIAAFFGATWEVHYNSNRTGVRLIGVKPQWARSDGGEAGLHPSNIHDNAYAVGTVDFTGDMPVILGPDGPSLGGFVCPVTLIKADLWKLGQLRPGNKVRFRRLTSDEALAAELRQEQWFIDPADGAREGAGDDLAKGADDDLVISRLRRSAGPPLAAAGPDAAIRGASKPSAQISARRRNVAAGGVGPGSGIDAAIVASLQPGATRPGVVYRRAGDKYLLVEYGALVLDLELRLRVHALMSWVQGAHLEGIIELTPGIRSLQIHYDSVVLPLERLLDLLMQAEDGLPSLDAMEIATRVVRLPLSWDDASTQLAIDKYMQSVRADAPWCPSNIEFIRRINGLDSVEDVKRIVFEASYWVLGLGDVYLGAPVCTPLDPRHRLVTTKYNPARTWTPENAVGIGGAYLCVYGMEGPGGYQFVGRTCQMWNTYHQTREFQSGTPWLLRFFDQLRFYPVSGAELLEFRRDFLHGQVQLDIRDEVFRLEDHRRFLADNAAGISLHKARQQEAFEAERRRWELSGQIGYAAELPPLHDEEAEEALPEGDFAVVSPVAGSVWKISSAPGQRVKAGETLLLVESMKMELPVTAPVDGEIMQLRCTEGRAVSVAQTLVILRPDAGRPHSIEQESV